ncbi:uncharacterized protein ARMOST_02689 [Armillaria ostoyae]|uniref:Uncharacterized protein n=1 Tax=Armillaria ostoyae TaxID=47428 RepID=A0A284QSD5_ARMOS|nr:uncharacterized protein ARMOST_02689 [Armillaria ostoyae]
MDTFELAKYQGGEWATPPSHNRTWEGVSGLDEHGLDTLHQLAYRAPEASSCASRRERKWQMVAKSGASSPLPPPCMKIIPTDTNVAATGKEDE